MNNMWKLNISSIQELILDPEFGTQWEQVTHKGAIPGNISHHTPAVFGHQVVIFGGINDYNNNPDVFEFDSTTEKWTKLQQTGDIPKSRDDHTLNQIDENSFLIFGGFVEGSRVNQCYVCRKVGQTLDWKLIA